jgi:hypothetical protein
MSKSKTEFSCSLTWKTNHVTSEDVEWRITSLYSCNSLVLRIMSHTRTGKAVGWTIFYWTVGLDIADRKLQSGWVCAVLTRGFQHVMPSSWHSLAHIYTHSMSHAWTRACSHKHTYFFEWPQVFWMFIISRPDCTATVLCYIYLKIWHILWSVSVFVFFQLREAPVLEASVSILLTHIDHGMVTMVTNSRRGDQTKYFHGNQIPVLVNLIIFMKRCVYHDDTRPELSIGYYGNKLHCLVAGVRLTMILLVVYCVERFPSQ